MVLNPRQMLGLSSNRPTMQFQQLNQAFQSDPRRILGQTLMGQGASAAPVATPLQGLGRLSSALVGAFLQRKASDDLAAREQDARSALLASLPANVSPAIRSAVDTAPAALQTAMLTSAVSPTTEAFTQPVGQGGAIAYGTKSVNPLTQQENVSISGIYKPNRPQKQDFVTLVNPNDATDVRTLQLGDSEIANLLGKGFVERQGAGSNISINTGPTQTVFQEKSAESAVKTITDLRNQVQTESDLVTRLNIADQLLEAGTETGPITNITMPLRNLGKELGFLNDEQARQLNNQQILTASFNYIIPRMRVVGSGATSDFEARLFTSATANMGNTPDANKALVKSMQALVERREKLLQAMEKYASDPNLGNGTLVGFSEYADQNVPPALKAYMSDNEFDSAVESGELTRGDLYFNGLTGTFEIYEG